MARLHNKSTALSTPQVNLVHGLHQQGKTQMEIAAIMEVNQCTVSRILARFPDTRPIAKARLFAAADAMAQNTIQAAKKAAEDGDAGPALEVLDRLDVLTAKRQPQQTLSAPKVMVIVGAVPGTVNALPDFTESEALPPAPEEPPHA